jgi:hypothetical protein
MFASRAPTLDTGSLGIPFGYRWMDDHARAASALFDVSCK